MTDARDQDNGLGGRASMREVAKHAGVAISSVSRVLNKHPDVSPHMRSRVLEAVADLGYEPDLLAQSLRRGATQSIGFVVGDISNPLFSEIALGAEMALQESGYALLVTNSQSASNDPMGQIRLLNQRRVDGLLLSVADEEQPAIAAEISRLRPPYVLIDRELEGTETAGAVFSDHGAGMEAAVQHLLDLGHRRIGFIGGSPRVRPTRERARAVTRVCERASARPIVVSGEFSADHGRDASAAMLDQPDPPTALIAGGNQILAGLLRTVRDRGLRVPEDLSIVTCDRLALSEFLQPPIATIERDTRLMGRRAAEILLRTIQTGVSERLTLPVTFSATASCGVPPTP